MLLVETLSDGLGRVILDNHHDEIRRRIRRAHSGTSGDHLVAGLKGLGFGLLGGMTSVFKQTYDGVAADGIPVSKRRPLKLRLGMSINFVIH